MIHVLFLASGGGGNFKFMHRAIEKKLISNIKLSMIADRRCGAIEFSEKVKIDSKIIQYTRSNPSTLQQLLNEMRPDFVVTNWHKIIDGDTLRQHQGKFVNLHYSLLPAFGGLIGIEPIKKAYELGCKYIGPTCHLLDEGVDTGKIIAQEIFSTNRSFDEAVKIMFQRGCLTLLSGLEILINQHGKKNNNGAIDFSSLELNYDHSSFDESFWQEVAMS